MKCLVIGLGSMGKRRIRCLKANGVEEIWGYDVSRETVKALEIDKEYIPYKLRLTCSSNVLDSWINFSCYSDDFKFDLILVCVPPTMKQPYIDLANTHGIPCFCEADIVSYNGEYYPSRTLVYHPAIKALKRVLEANKLGEVYAFSYHMGQHILDWHKGANYENYYAAKQKTGACREMFDFELAWLSWLFGVPFSAKGFISKHMLDLNVTADDVFSTIVRFNRNQKEFPCENGELTGTMLIDIVSRPAVRLLTIVCEKGNIIWDWTKSYITVNGEHTELIPFYKGDSHGGYDENIPELMYEEEIKSLLDDVKIKSGLYKYTKADEERIIQLLRGLEYDNFGESR